MTATKERPIKIRALNALCAMALLGSIIYMLIAGLKMVALGVFVLALAGVATPVVMGSGEGILEIFLGIFEAIIEGVMAIVEGIANAIAGLFG